MRAWRASRLIFRPPQTTGKPSATVRRSSLREFRSSPTVRPSLLLQPDEGSTIRNTRTVLDGDLKPLPRNLFCFVCGRVMPNTKPRSPVFTPAKYCSQRCRRRAPNPSSELDKVIVEIFWSKLDEGPVKTAVTCDEVTNAVPSSMESTREQLGPALPLLQDLRERVRCVARRSVVLDTQGLESKGRLEGVEAVTQGRVLLAEQLSTHKGDFGLRRSEL